MEDQMDPEMVEIINGLLDCIKLQQKYTEEAIDALDKTKQNITPTTDARQAAFIGNCNRAQKRFDRIHGEISAKVKAIEEIVNSK